MGRNKINTEEKKQKLSITISFENYNKIEDMKNKSKLINWLLVEYFELNENNTYNGI